MKWVWTGGGTGHLDHTNLCERIDLSQTIESAAAWDHETLKDGIQSGSIPQCLMKDAMESLSNNEEWLVEIVEELYSKEIANHDLQVAFNLALPTFVGKKTLVTVKDLLNWSTPFAVAYACLVEIYMHALHQMRISCLSDRSVCSRMRGYCDPCNYLGGWIYLNRLKGKIPGLRIDAHNFQRLITVATMLAAKFFNDDVYCNSVWAEIGGVTLKQLNKLEREMLDLLEWSLRIDVDEYDASRDLLSRLAWGSNVDRDCGYNWSSCPSSPVAGASDTATASLSSSDTNFYHSTSPLLTRTATSEFMEPASPRFEPIEGFEELGLMEEWEFEQLELCLSSVPIEASLECSVPAKSRGIEQSFDSCTTAISQCSTPRARYHHDDLHRSIDSAQAWLGGVESLSRTSSVDFFGCDHLQHSKAGIHQSFDINRSIDCGTEHMYPPIVASASAPPPLTSGLDIVIPGGAAAIAAMWV